jgi:hypothetical protein
MRVGPLVDEVRRTRLEIQKECDRDLIKSISAHWKYQKKTLQARLPTRPLNTWMCLQCGGMWT